MIARYTSSEMTKIWSENHKLETWLEVELAVAEAQAALNIIPKSAYQQMKRRARINPRRAAQIEKLTNHDIIAFVSSTAETMGPVGRYLHYGLTSTDVVDTAQSLRLREAADLIEIQLKQLEQVLRQKARQYKYTVMIGRSHGVHAEPITFGLKLAVFWAEVKRQQVRLKQARASVEVCKLSGAVGTYANQDPRVESRVAKKLKMPPEIPATQVVARDRHAAFCSTLALIGGTLEKIAVEIRHLHRTEIREAEEFFAKGQKGSSAMPHKRNPILCERITGLARLLRGYAATAMENIALWHERDISHSSVERMILPDATATLEYQLRLMVQVMRQLVVHPAKMKSNLDLTYGLFHSQQVLLGLIGKGMTRDQAYRKVQKLAMQAWEKQQNFKQIVMQDPEIKARFGPSDYKTAFDLGYHTKYIQQIFRRLQLNR